MSQIIRLILTAIFPSGAGLTALALLLGGLLPPGSQMLYSWAPGWRSGPWAVYLLDVERGLGQQYARSYTNGTPDLPVAWSPDGQRIVYTVYSDRAHLHLGDLGHWRRQIQVPDADETFGATWSPDGRWLAFFARSGINEQIYLADADGSSVRPLTEPGGFTYLTWSPDSRSLAYQSVSAGEDIFVLDIDSGTRRNLSRHPAADLQPVWSPDGNFIAFLSNRAGDGGQLDLYIADTRCDPSRETCAPARQLTSSLPVLTSWAIRWSPNAGKIVFGSDAWGGGHDIYLIDVADGSVRNITADAARDSSASWSPTGDQMVFESRLNGRWQLFTVDAEGNNRRPITGAAYDSRLPIWSPQGDYIAFISNRARNWDIYRLNIQHPGSIQRLTHNRGIHFSPVWRPTLQGLSP